MNGANLVHNWLIRAKSNLEKAKAGKVSSGIMFEDLCFDCHQAAEKSLKALLICREIDFPKTHSISRLLEIIEGTGTQIPEEIKDSVILTDYAVETQYPGDYVPIDEKMYEEALRIADSVVKWVEKMLVAKH
ncbi:MAG: HEPN domain-containing protein [Nitrospirae bacterium]|nr:HEPN domain-containing protein [Nitrospirota bacterium]MBF0535720.1 HEPN domain-containing protein [Nitrospirota bacterium]MBF0617545.1 HEPN domain-containing protein [Nitrospirota bacterium]